MRSRSSPPRGVPRADRRLLGRLQFDGRVGYGFLEYHDLLLDGVPQGINEA